MQTTTPPVTRDIVLIGGGHSHVGVLRHFGMQPVPGVRLTVICTDTHTPYSGMLPGYVAGHYDFDAVHIDLGRLAVLAGARRLRDEVIGIDRANRLVLCRHRPPVAYDLLSINTGSTPQLAKVSGAAQHAVPVKPIHQFNQRWLALLLRVRRQAQQLAERPFRTAVVGAGAGGVELLLAVQYRLRREVQMLGGDPDGLHFHLVSASEAILPTHNARVRRHFERVLAERGVQVHHGAEVAEVVASGLRCTDGRVIEADETLWVTQAGGAHWLKGTGLALDADGFILVNDSLQSISDPHVFAAGDVATLQARPLEKAGVFAVRQGRPLANNLRRSLQGRALQPYRPQRRWLALISTGDKSAVASRGPGLWGLGFAGEWVWRWKDHIDRRFMRMFSAFQAMQPAGGARPASSPVQGLALTADESLQAISAVAMRCGGCGAKVGSTVLARALGRLSVVPRDEVLVGLRAGDDAAIVRVPPGKAMVHTVDFFRAMVDDPYLFGRIAANHALGDVFAMGADAQTATAIATVPPGLDAKVEDQLLQMMTGAVEVLNNAGCALIGGHTGEGQELALGFAIQGLIDESLQGAMLKAGLRPGDALILTKPLGTGTLFAAHAQGRAKGRWIDAALTTMQQSSQQAAQCLRVHGAQACTDVTGFGLLGHLVEMTQPSGVQARIELSALPLLEGAQDMVSVGIFSSLQEANVRLRRVLQNAEQFAIDPRYPLLFDPQTAGGLLAGVPAAHATACIADLHAQGYTEAAVIGQVLAATGSALAPILLAD